MPLKNDNRKRKTISNEEFELLKNIETTMQSKLQELQTKLESSCLFNQTLLKDLIYTTSKQPSKSTTSMGLHACIQLLVFFDEVFEALFKKKNDETKTASEAQAELSCRNLWILFRNFWVSLTTDFDDPLVEKETQSQKVQFNAKLFVEGWNCVAGKNKSAYMHYLLVHLEEQVARFGDLRKYSAQGLEHLHSIFKSLLFSNTNRHVVDRVRQEAVCVMYGATNPQGHSEIERAALENGKKMRAIARKRIKFTKKEVIQEKPLLALADITNTYRPARATLPPPSPLPPPPPPVARHLPVVTAASITPQLSKANAATHALLQRAKESMKIQAQQRKKLKT